MKMSDYDDIIKAYTGFSAVKYSKLFDVPLEDVLQDVLNNYTEQSKSHHESLMNIQWESLDNPKSLSYNSNTI